MRVVFVGASSITVRAAEQMSYRGHEVVIVEKDGDRIAELSSDLDCGFVQGDGAHPRVLKDVGPETTDVLFCLSDSDADNIIAALVGQTMEFGRVIVKVEDPDYESVCSELGLETIVPDRRVARELEDMMEGHESAQLVALVKGGVRFFSFICGDAHAGPVQELDVPEGARVIALNREEDTLLVEPDTEIEKEDEVVLIATPDGLEELEKRFGRKKQ